jgi:hypothetical protein
MMKKLHSARQKNRNSRLVFNKDEYLGNKDRLGRKSKSPIDWRGGSSSRVLALKREALNSNPCPTKKKKKNPSIWLWSRLVP